MFGQMVRERAAPGFSNRSTRTGASAKRQRSPEALVAEITTARAPAASFLGRQAGVVHELSDLHEVDYGFDAVQAGHSLAHLC